MNIANYHFGGSRKLVLEKYPDIELSVTEHNLPGIQGTTALGTRPLNAQVPFSSDSLVFNPLTVTFLVDEMLDNWVSMFNLMKSASPFADTETYDPDAINTDAKILFYDSEDRVIMTATFYYCVLTQLSDVDYTENETEPQPQTASAVFMYDYYDIERHSR